MSETYYECKDFALKMFMEMYVPLGKKERNSNSTNAFKLSRNDTFTDSERFNEISPHSSTRKDNISRVI